MALGESKWSVSFPALSSPNLPITALWLGPQDQLKQLQDILGSLSVQEESRRTSQQHLDQKVNSEAQQSSSLVAQLRAMVADRESKVRQLELEIGQLSGQVSGCPRASMPVPTQPLPLAMVTSAWATASSQLHGSSCVRQPSFRSVHTVLPETQVHPWPHHPEQD